MMMKKSFVAFGLAALAFTGSSRGGSVVFENANSLQNATRVDTITLPGDFQGDAQGLEVQLSMCSQSMSNYRANGVTVRFLRNGNEIASKTDSYPSESNWGSIPCYDHHVLRFPAIWMKSGESLQMETTVWSGDYANRLANQIVYAGDQVTPERRACTSSETLPFDHGKLENNEWGGTPAVQCVLSRDPGRLTSIPPDTASGTAGWFSEVSAGAPLPAPNYPELICGRKPWMTSSTTPALPITLTALARLPLIVTWNAESDATGDHNLALEGWITSQLLPTPQERVAEVMVMMGAVGMVPDGALQLANVDIGTGELFDLYSGVRSDATASWTIYTLIPHTLLPSAGSIDFAQVVTWLVKNRYISGTAALADIEFGNEILSGRVRTIFNSLTVKRGAGTICQLPALIQMNIQGKGIAIAAGDTAPDISDDTHWGGVTLGSTVSHTFSILSTGSAALNLTGNPPVTLLGRGCAPFAVTLQPVTPVASGGSATFDLGYTPTSGITSTCTVRIANKDPSRNPYTFAIAGIGLRIGQTITFGAAPTLILGDSATLSATGGASGNPVTFSSRTPTVCTVAGSIVSDLTAGNCVIAANQAGNSNYAAAPVATQRIPVSRVAQTITFGAVPKLILGGSATVSATGGASGNPVTFSSRTPTVCTVAGSTVSDLTAGSCVIDANQEGNMNYTAAHAVKQRITVK